MIGYKGLDQNFRCRDFQYEVGKTYKFDGEPIVCERGFHFCDTPLAVFEFYSPADSRFALVEATGKIVKGEENTHKFCTDELKIIKELSLTDLNHYANESQQKPTASNTGYRSSASNTGDCSSASNTGYRSSASNTGDCSSASNTGDCSSASNTGYCSSASNTGDCSSASNTGDCSSASNTGDCSSASNTGDYSSAAVSGKNSVAVVTGKDSYAKGALDCWIVLTERDEQWNIIEVKAFKVDGDNIKPDTFYTLKNGHPVEVNSED